MSATLPFDIAGGRLAAIGVRDDMMEFQEAGFGAAALFAAKRALSGVARPHVAFDRCRNVARSRSRRAITLRPIRGGEP